MEKGKATDWKKQYKLRHNWAKGCCNLSETKVAEAPSIPPLLISYYRGVVVTADSNTGLCAWSIKGEHKMLASMNLSSDERPTAVPTSLAIDSTDSEANEIHLAVGFTDGACKFYRLLTKQRTFVPTQMHVRPGSSSISTIAYASPYLLIMDVENHLLLHRLTSELADDQESSKGPSFHLISTLKSHTAWPPVALTIRTMSQVVIASIAYAVPTYLSGWSVGLQELRLSPGGIIIGSRVASATAQGFSTFVYLPPGTTLSLREANEASPNTVFCRPTSLSYNHPYLLAAHPDNTLTLYMVMSNAEGLSIGVGTRLWGHTSSVSGAYVGDRGKAVSVSRYGNELRVWGLEGGVPFNGPGRYGAVDEASIRVQHEQAKPESTSTADQGNHSTELTRHSDAASNTTTNLSCEDQTVSEGWLAFDDETVVVLRGKTHGAQTLTVYDFT